MNRVLRVISIAGLLCAALARSQTAAAIGEWQTLTELTPINPIHVQLLHTNEILIVAGSGYNKDKHDAGNFQAALYDWQSGIFEIQDLEVDLFCSGQTALADGRILIAGGTDVYGEVGGAVPTGETVTTIYDPITKQFVPTFEMSRGRWYATTTLLPDGRVLAFSGRSTTGPIERTIEVFQIGSGWTAPQTAPFAPALYPWLHLLPDGRILLSGDQVRSRFYTPNTGIWGSPPTFTHLHNSKRLEGSSVLLPLGPSDGYRARVMVLGGTSPAATDTTEITDLSVQPPAWTSSGVMPSGARIDQNAVLLPDGQVFVSGGSARRNVTATAKRTADLFDPNTGAWSSDATAVYARHYHSVALLLPDARVWVAGSNRTQATYEQHMEIYSPSYLFTGTRPSIASAPSRVGYGAPFQVGSSQAMDIGSVVLIRPGSNTHAFDMDQRLIRLVFTPGPTTLDVISPPNSNIAPPGYYMLFIVSQSGVPSVAEFVQVVADPNNQPPTGSIVSPGQDVHITAGQSVTFSGTGSDPEGTVLSYSWYFPGGTPEDSSTNEPGAIQFDEPGVHVVSMEVLDAQGANDPSPPTRTVMVYP